MARRAYSGTVVTCAIALAMGFALRGGWCAEQPIMRQANVAPDRGNQPGTGYVTDARSAIHRFHNEDLEVSFWDGPSPMTFSLAKNDVWDRRYFGDRKDIIDLDDVRRVCFSGKIGYHSDLGLPNSPQAVYHAYDFPCPKPVGQMRVTWPGLAEGAEWQAGEGADGGLVARAAAGEARASLRALLLRTRNVLVVRGEYAGLDAPVRVQLYRHKDTTARDNCIFLLTHYGGKMDYDYSQDPGNGPLPDPEAGADGRFFWVRQRFHAEKTFPQGFEYVMMGVLDGAAYRTRARDGVKGAGTPYTVHPMTDEQGKGIPGYLLEERMAAERFNEAEYGSVAEAEVGSRAGSFVLYLSVVTTRDAADPLAAAREELEKALATGPEALARESARATPEAVRQWRLSRVMHYNATSCTYADATPWHGDYHFNEGYSLPSIVAGDVDGLEQRLRLFEEMVPILRRNAREVYHCDGLAFPLVHYPIKSDRVVYGSVTWEWGLENTGLMLQPFWQVFQYTWDVDFLRERAYPMMREGARFYADYVTKGDDGLYHVIPTVSQEHWGFTPEFKLNRDSVGALSFVKYHLRACIQASEILGVNAEERERWREIVEHLVPYPTLETDEGPVFCDVRDAPRLLNYNITANLVMVLWAEDISLDSPPELLEMARRSYRALPDKEHSPRPGYLAQIRLTLGMPEKPDLSPLGRCLSWPGRIHLYAGVPEGTSLNDSFSGFLAAGGFEVAAAHSATDVRGVRITSRAGRTCRVKSPWPSGEVKVMDLAGRDIVPHRLEGDTIVFDTEAGHTYALLSGPELALATKRFIGEERVIGRWTFDAQEEDGLIADQSGRGHHAALVGGAALVPADGGKALAVDGEAQYARVDRTADFDFAADESFSVEARVRMEPAEPRVTVPIVCSMATRQYCFFLSDGRVKLYLSSPRGDVYCQVTGSTVLGDDEWHLVRGVRDVSDRTIKVYVDGKLDGTAPDTTQGDFASDAPVTIGAYLWGEHSRYARGQIDDVAIKSLGRLVDR